jgi:hypothetical protein
VIATQAWWHLARSAGLVAWALICASVIWGLLLSTRVLGRRPGRPWLLAMHRYLSALALAFVGLHVAALLVDSYIQFRIVDVVVPMASSWRPGALAWGIVALYLVLAVEMTSLMGDRLPRRLWWSIHLASFAVFTLATVHGLQAGTDASNALVRIVMIVGIAEVTFVLGVRVVYRRQAWR